MSYHLYDSSALEDRQFLLITRINNVPLDIEMPCHDPLRSFKYEDSCYQLTPFAANWYEVRNYCMNRGGDLAEFKSQMSLAVILQNLDEEKEDDIDTWMKVSNSTDSAGRRPHSMEEGFQPSHCLVSSNYDDEGTENSCHSACCVDSRGLCIFPPISPFKSPKLKSCPAKCVTAYPEYCWPEELSDTKAFNKCPDGFDGLASWNCGLDSKWETPLS